MLQYQTSFDRIVAGVERRDHLAHAAAVYAVAEWRGGDNPAVGERNMHIMENTPLWQARLAHVRDVWRETLLWSDANYAIIGFPDGRIACYPTGGAPVDPTMRAAELVDYEIVKWAYNRDIIAETQLKMRVLMPIEATPSPYDPCPYAGPLLYIMAALDVHRRVWYVLKDSVRIPKTEG
jgi:hypothetical protein